MIEKKSFVSIVSGLLVLLGLHLTSLHSYLLFHSIIEIFSIVVACGIFMLAWNSRRFLENTYLLFLGIAYLFVGGLDLIHTLAYTGMGVFEGYGTNLPTQLWIAARYVESFSLLIAPLLLGRKLRVNVVFLGYVSVTSLLLASIFYWNLFPACFIEGAGLTPFKKISEYTISLILLASIAILLKKRRDLDVSILRLLIASIVLTIASELAFTLYVHAYGLPNMIGHYLKIVSFYLIYKAIIETGLARPYALLFRELKQSEEALRESEERFRQMSESVRDAFWLGTAGDGDRGRILYVNPAFEEIFGIKAEEIYKSDTAWIEMLHEDDRDRVLKAMQEFVQGRGEYDVEYRIVRDQGAVRWIWAKAFPVRDEMGEIVRTAGIAQDITERKQADAAIIRAKQEWERTFDAVSDLIMILDNEYRVVRANKAMADRLGCTTKDLVGQICYDAFHGIEKPKGHCPHARLMADGLAHSAEMHEDRLGGDFLVSVNPLHDPGGKLVGSVHMARDITERKKAEEVLRNRTHDLGERVKELNCLYGISHLVEKYGVSMEEILQGTVDLIPSAWRYPEAACARIILGDREFRTRIFQETMWKQKGDIIVYGHQLGSLEVYYLEEKPRRDEGPFRKEERRLIEAVAERLGRIIERKRAEEELRTEKEFSGSMLNAMVDTVFVFNPNTGKPLRWNKAFNEISGYTDYEIASIKTPDGWYEEADLKRAEATMKKIFRDGRATVEMSLMAKDGRLIPTEYTGSLVKNAEGKPEYILAIGRDITERRRAREALQKAHDELEQRVEERTAELMEANEQLKHEIVERERAQEALRESEGQLRYLSSQLLSAQENERKSVAQELHDSIGQTLAAIKFGAEKALEQLKQRSSRTAKTSLEAVVSMVQNGIEEVRRIQMDLRPPTLDDLGILATISWFCREFQRIYSGIRIEQQINIQEDNVPDPLKTIIYRVLQEALNNVVKHSKADRVRLSLRKGDGTVELAIEDNGQGFDVEDVLSVESSKRGIGVSSMKERTELSGGSFAIESVKGTGTTIRSSWPKRP